MINRKVLCVARTQLKIEEDQGNHNLKRGWPNEINKGAYLYESLRIYGH